MIGHPTREVRMLPTLPTTVEWSPMLDEPPCDLCLLAAQCRAPSQACEQFKSFVMFGGRRWRTEPREPSAEIYAKVYRETGDEAIAA